MDTKRKTETTGRRPTHAAPKGPRDITAAKHKRLAAEIMHDYAAVFEGLAAYDRGERVLSND